MGIAYRSRSCSIAATSCAQRPTPLYESFAGLRPRLPRDTSCGKSRRHLHELTDSYRSVFDRRHSPIRVFHESQCACRLPPIEKSCTVHFLRVSNSDNRSQFSPYRGRPTAADVTTLCNSRTSFISNSTTSYYISYERGMLRKGCTNFF